VPNLPGKPGCHLGAPAGRPLAGLLWALSLVAVDVAAMTSLPGRTFRDCSDCPEVVVLPAGGFLMGMAGNQPDELPVHRVAIRESFAMGKHEITWDDWAACVRAGACPGLSDHGWGRGRKPVINVSWDQARGYARWLSKKTGKRYRLPSEAEWEYAARAGSGDSRHWGNHQAPACECANVSNPTGRKKDGFEGESFLCEDGYDDTAPVGSFKPNAFGLHDMLGNVWEWTADCYHDDYQGAPVNGKPRTKGDCRYRVYRGGSWVSVPDLVRSAVRNRGRAGLYDTNLGFRLVRELP
jgi:formylglycine-generating enzyme required for sulfatase activity